MDMMSLRRRVMVNQNKLMTATGNPITFNTPLTKPLKECVVRFTPKQSGSGTPSPENVREIVGKNGITVWQSGKNLLDESTVTIGHGINGSGTIVTVSDAAYTELIPVKVGEIYTFSATSGNSHQWARRLHYYDSDGNWIAQGGAVSTSTGIPIGSRYSITVTVPSGVSYIKISYCYGFTETNRRDVDPQLEIGSTATEYEAYAPVETSVSFPAVGKNLCPDISTWESGYTNNVGGINHANSTRLEKYSDYIPVDELEDYTFSYNADGITEQLWTCICAYDENKEYLIRHTSNSNFVSRKLIAGTRFVRLSCRTYGMATEAQFEKSAEPTAYETFDNTVYGGYVDIAKGELVAEYACVTLDGVNLKVKNSYARKTDDVFGAGWVYCDPAGKNNVYGKYCETLPVYVGTVHEPPFLFVPSAGRLYCVVYCGKISEHPEITTNAERVAFTNAWLQEHPVTFAYNLTNPIHYPLTPQSITTLKGQNVMWSDGDELTVKYWTR